MSQSPSEYVIQPPNIPDFLFKKHKSAWDELIQWSQDEFQARLRYCASHGYWKELKSLNQNSSPAMVLAELHGLKKWCSLISQDLWDSFGMRNRRTLRNAYQLRDLLRRD